MMLTMIRPYLLALLTLLPLGALAQPATELPEAVAANVRARVAGGENEGVVVGIVDSSGARSYGFGRLGAGREDTPGAQTLFEIGSVTKVFTALLLAEMAERGDVALDDPVAAYLPDTVATSFGEQVTLAHLATHTSGLPRLPANLAPADPANPYADYTAGQMYGFLADYTLPREPGAAFEYSNLGAGLLGHLLARHAGTSYEALLRARVLGPLGLGDTGVTLTPAQQARLAPGYSAGQPVPGWDLPTLAGAGALRSSADDLLRYLAAHLGLAELGLAETPLAEAMRATHAPRSEAGRDSVRIGLGWMVQTTGGGEILWHNGGTGGYRSFIGFDRDRGRGVVVLTNSDLGLDDVGLHLLDPSFPLKEVRETADLAPEFLERYVGQYQLAPGFDITVRREGSQLYGQATGQPEFRLYPASETEFFLKVVEAEVSFDLAEDGRVEGLVLHQNGQRLPGSKIR